MKFFFAFNVSPEINKILPTIRKIELELQQIFIKNDYGQGVQELYVGIICVSPLFEKFFKPKGVRYDREKRVYQKTDITFELYRTLQFEILLDFNAIIGAAEKDIKISVVNSILDFTANNQFEHIVDFNLRDFRNDLEKYLNQ